MRIKDVAVSIERAAALMLDGCSLMRQALDFARDRREAQTWERQQKIEAASAQLAHSYMTARRMIDETANSLRNLRLQDGRHARRLACAGKELVAANRVYQQMLGELKAVAVSLTNPGINAAEQSLGGPGEEIASNHERGSHSSQGRLLDCVHLV